MFKQGYQSVEILEGFGGDEKEGRELTSGASTPAIRILIV